VLTKLRRSSFACPTFQCYWAKGSSDTYNAVNLALGALFFRSCPPHLNLPPLPKEERMERGEEKPEKEEL
jgi:hypothetical protein